jgi:hypothetical protein
MLTKVLSTVSSSASSDRLYARMSARLTLPFISVRILLPRRASDHSWNLPAGYRLRFLPLAGSQRRYRVCWLAGGDTIVPWNDSGLAA